MTNLTPYLLFDGKCQQAMRFYQSCFGGELTATKVMDSPAEDFRFRRSDKGKLYCLGSVSGQAAANLKLKSLDCRF